MTQAEIYTAVPAHLPKNFPFYNWVPKPLGIAFLVILFIPIMTVSGAYSVNSSEMVGGLGIQSEHIAFISFVTSIGMAAFSPFFYQLVCVRRQKMMSLVGFSILAVQSYICANTDSLFILALNSLIMGFVRQTLLMCNLFTLIKYGFGIEATRNVTAGNEPSDEAGWDALDTEKKASQPIIYFFFMLLGQIGTWLTAWFAYNYHWQMVYYAMLGSILVALLITLVCMPYNPYPTKRSPLSFSKFGNVVVFCLMCCSFIYIMVYGKVYDWYDDAPICWATVICVVSTLLFVYLAKTDRARKHLAFVLRIYRNKLPRLCSLRNLVCLDPHAADVVCQSFLADHLCRKLYLFLLNRFHTLSSLFSVLSAPLQYAVDISYHVDDSLSGCLCEMLCTKLCVLLLAVCRNDTAGRVYDCAESVLIEAVL